MIDSKVFETTYGRDVNVIHEAVDWVRLHLSYETDRLISFDVSCNCTSTFAKDRPFTHLVRKPTLSMYGTTTITIIWEHNSTHKKTHEKQNMQFVLVPVWSAENYGPQFAEKITRVSKVLKHHQAKNLRVSLSCSCSPGWSLQAWSTIAAKHLIAVPGKVLTAGLSTLGSVFTGGVRFAVLACWVPVEQMTSIQEVELNSERSVLRFLEKISQHELDHSEESV